MALQSADLPPDSRIAAQGEVKGTGAQAAYRRTFFWSPSGRGARFGKARVVALVQDVYLTTSPANAEFAALQYSIKVESAAQRQSLGTSMLRGAGRKGRAQARQLTVGAPRTPSIGDLAIVRRLRLKTRRDSIQGITAVLTVDRVTSALVLVARPKSKASERDFYPLLRQVGQRITQSLLPHTVAPPAIAGAVRVGETLRAGTGTWDPATPPKTFAYQWERCDAAGANCQALDGATGQAYNVANADRASTLRATVTASNAVGSAAASSAVTAVVQ